MQAQLVSWNYELTGYSGAPSTLNATLALLLSVGIERAAFYGTEPLRRTLGELVDLDYLNAHNVRLTVGAVGVYVGFFAIGLGPVFWLLISEIFPLRVRARGMSLAAVATIGAASTVATTSHLQRFCRFMRSPSTGNENTGL